MATAMQPADWVHCVSWWLWPFFERDRRRRIMTIDISGRTVLLGISFRPPKLNSTMFTRHLNSRVMSDNNVSLRQSTLCQQNPPPIGLNRAYCSNSVINSRVSVKAGPITFSSQDYIVHGSFLPFENSPTRTPVNCWDWRNATPLKLPNAQT